MRDFLPADVRKRNYVIGIIKSVYESYGFEPLETPAVENIETGFVKYIDEDNQVAEAETILAATETLNRLGFKNFSIGLNHRQVLADILDTVGIPEIQHPEVLTLIENFISLDYSELSTALRELEIPEKASEMLVEIFGHTQEILSRESDINRTIISNLINIVSNELLIELGQILRLSGDAPVVLDPSLAREFPFYTGSIIEINLPDHYSDSLGSGGRYDFSKEILDPVRKPACRFEFEIDRLVSIMNEREMFSALR